MKRASAAGALCAALAALALLAGAGTAQPTDGPLVRSVELDMTINPASAAWVERERSTTPSRTAPTS